ncbi:TatD family hydrolase [Tyzzerella sp. OttesenSCG-928-J15]|nr:TatD family hydrolase [Tyzzerella sp. OttesenSCG-928-J15]
MNLYDMHCHIDLMTSMTDFASEAKKMGISVLAVTTTPKAYAKEITSLRSFANIRVGLGLHPQLVSERFNELSLVEKYIGEADYIGEIGLDFNSRFYSSKENQIIVFENIIKWCSQKGGKVISIHTVRSDKTVLDILEKYRCTEKNKCILHWFSGSMTQLRRAVEMGCYFSINGIMIKSPNGQKLIPSFPIEKVLTESDAPFINNIGTPQQLEAEIRSVEMYLSAIWSQNTTEIIHSTSKSFF